MASRFTDGFTMTKRCIPTVTPYLSTTICSCPHTSLVYSGPRAITEELLRRNR